MAAHPREHFVGREDQLGLLASLLAEVRSSGRGRLVLVRGRRQVGKSRLAGEFCTRAGVASVYFQATRGRHPRRELEEFATVLAASGLPGAAEVAAGATPRSWDAVLALVARLATKEAPAVVVIDELPWLIEGSAEVEGALQTAWDRSVSGAPVLLVLIGSDLSVMSALGDYGRPLYDRGRILRLDPLAPSEVAAMLGLDAAGALDAYCAIGGFPNLVRTWPRGRGLRAFLAGQLADPTSPLIVAGERALAAEFPAEAQARAVLEAIGSGEAEHRKIASVSGIEGGSLERALVLLAEKGVVERLAPYSARPPGRATRWVVADPYLRFWLRHVYRALPEIERGRGHLVAERVVEAWPAYRGVAIEPIVREALTRMLPDRRFGKALHVGSWWRRDQRIQVDLVGGLSPDEAGTVCFVGSVKWRERSPFGPGDLRALASAATEVPGAGASVPLVAVSRAGFDRVEEQAVGVTPEDLIAAW